MLLVYRKLLCLLAVSARKRGALTRLTPGGKPLIAARDEAIVEWLFAKHSRPLGSRGGPF